MDLQAASSHTETTIREHAWVIVTENPHIYWEQRDCGICGLRDMRVREEQKRDKAIGEWRVLTPCIEPVPERMTYQELLEDLARHQFALNKPPYRFVPHVVGNPDHWRMGFQHVAQHGAIHLNPGISIKPPQEMEHGWARVLQWVRARQYDPYTYERYQSTNVHGTILTPPPCHHDEDD